MKQLVILSGKGGTGKTTLSASFAHLAGSCVLVDADVDAADLHVVVSHEVREIHPFVSGKEAQIDRARCTACGLCRTHCRFGAISEDFQIDPFACEGCGVCKLVCPAEAVQMQDRDCGQWFVSEAPFGPFIHARLHVAAENSGRLVSLIREKARDVAREDTLPLVIIDGPPGVGCPVIASVTGADAVLIVTEPSRSGRHDLERTIGLARHFKVPAYAIINKADLHPETSKEIAAFCQSVGVAVLGEIPFDRSVVEVMTRRISLAEGPDGPARRAMMSLWGQVCATLGLGQKHDA